MGGKTSSLSVLLHHGEVDTSNGKTSSPSVLPLHGVVDTSNSRTSSSSDIGAHTEPTRSQLVAKVLHINTRNMENSVSKDWRTSSQWVLLLHGEVDTCHSRTSSPSVLLLHGVVDTSNGKTSSPLVFPLHGEV